MQTDESLLDALISSHPKHHYSIPQSCQWPQRSQPEIVSSLELPQNLSELSSLMKKLLSDALDRLTFLVVNESPFDKGAPGCTIHEIGRNSEV